MIEIVKVSSRGQVVIPERIRKKLGIKEGSKLVVLESEDKLILEQEKNFLSNLETIDKERLGWLALSERSMAKIWDNAKDDIEWGKYL